MLSAIFLRGNANEHSYLTSQWEMNYFIAWFTDENAEFSILTPELDQRLLLRQLMSDIYERGSLHGALLEVMLAPD